MTCPISLLCSKMTDSDDLSELPPGLQDDLSCMTTSQKGHGVQVSGYRADCALESVTVRDCAEGSLLVSNGARVGASKSRFMRQRASAVVATGSGSGVALSRCQVNQRPFWSLAFIFDSFRRIFGLFWCLALMHDACR